MGAQAAPCPPSFPYARPCRQRAVKPAVKAACSASNGFFCLFPPFIRVVALQFSPADPHCLVVNQWDMFDVSCRCFDSLWFVAFLRNMSGHGPNSPSSYATSDGHWTVLGSHYRMFSSGGSGIVLATTVTHSTQVCQSSHLCFGSPPVPAVLL